MLYILTPLFCVALLCGTVFSFSKTGDKVYAATGSAPASILDLSGSGTFKSALQGAQKENIYFGTNNGSPVKWRVLSTGDSKYGDGNSMLLWSDNVFGPEKYNYSYQNPDYAFWGTSQIRASLNGGDYYTSGSSDTANPTSKTSITEANSKYGTMFNDDEKGLVVAAGTYTTDNWGLDTRQSQYLYLKEGITATVDGTNGNGKYNTNRINAASHPTSKWATVTEKEGVQETTSGDKLFLLDYYDINNTSYGFGDGSLTYANKVDASWTPSSNKYPSYHDGNGSSWNNITSSYLTFSGAADQYYWLRSAGRVNTANSGALVVHSSGYVDRNAVSNTSLVRPAFNLDSTKIAYATATAPTANNSFDDLTISPATPEYKVYLKDSQYDSYTNSAKANVRDENGNLYITYNNPTGVSDGNLLVLLSSKTAKGGEVDYQAAFTVSAEASASKLVATSISLPANVSLSSHFITLLYTTANGGNATENIYCSYSTGSGIDAPQNISGFTYDGKSKWISDLNSSEKPAWLNLDIYNNTAYMSVKSIEYTNSNDDVITVSTADIKSAGTYKVTMKLADGLKWSDGTLGEKTFTITINKADPTVDPQYEEPESWYESGGLPELTNISTGTAGKFSYGDQTASASKKSYTWTFTPDDANNYNKKTGTINFDFIKAAIDSVKFSVKEGETVYDAYTLTELKKYLKVTAVYEDGKEVVTSDYTVTTADGKLTSDTNGECSITVRLSDGTKLTGKIPVTKAVIEEIEVECAESFTYPVTLDGIKEKIDVYVKWNYNNKGIKVSDKSVLELTGEIAAGTPTLTVKYKGTEKSQTFTVTVNKGTYNIDDSLFADKTVTDTGSAFNPEGWIDTSKLPEGMTVTYSCSTDLTAVGEHVVTATFSNPDPDNYNNPASKTAKLTITDKPVHDMSNTKYSPSTGSGLTEGENGGFKGTYGKGDFVLGDPVGMPSGVSVSGTTIEKLKKDGNADNPDDWEVVDKIDGAGDYRVTTSFDGGDGYAPVPDISTTVSIGKGTHDMDGAGFKPESNGGSGSTGGLKPSANGGFTGTYNPDGGFDLNIDSDSLPAGVTPKAPTYKKLKKGGNPANPDDWEVVDEIKGAGEYKVEVDFEYDEDNYNELDPVSTVVTIDKADVDLPEDTFKDSTVLSDGSAHKAEVKDLPDGVKVKYEYTDKDGKKHESETPFEFTEPGNYVVKAYFEPTDKDNYNEIEPIEVTLTISDAVVTGVVAKLEEGATFTAENTLDDLKAKLTAEIEYNNGTKETLKPEDFEVTCNGLRENGKFKAGIQSVTVKYGDFETVVNLTVNKVKVAVPTFKGGLSYTGIAVKPTVENFNGYDAEIMTFVTDKTLSGLNAGSYKAVFALNDVENYEWATTTANKKAVYKVTLYDEEIPLVAGETAVDWTLTKAKITATTSEGELPVFASESYKGALSGIVGLKYYKDEACTEEISAEELGYETTYYVKAELLDGDNFELDTSAAELTVAPVPYTTPAKELTFWEKVVVFLKANWLWIVIAVVALILLITIIALCVRASKKKRKREELAEQRRLEKEEREREERRLEREERMARLSQQQAAPQPQYIPQPMPQMMPQMQMPMSQPMAQQGGMAMGGGSVDNAQITRIETELAAMKAAQEARELAAIKAEQAAMHSDINALRGDYPTNGNGQIMAGMTAATLVEIVTAAMEKVLDKREKPAEQTAQQTESAPASTQVPPDAVMTTVTTTKIDTTKKPVQSTNDRAPVGRPIVRNYVAPMPVDDGRVFDVGGFYKPADISDDLANLISEEEDKKN